MHRHDSLSSDPAGKFCLRDRSRSRRLSFCALLSLFFVSALGGVLAAQTHDIVLQGTIRSNQRTSYVLVPFTVPHGTDRLTVSFTYTGRQEKSTIDLGLLDPERFRGWSGGNKSDFTVSTTDATPSYLPGPLPAGEWKLMLGVAHVRPGNSVTYTARIDLVPLRSAEPDSFSAHPLATGARWYRGDLHVHTAHSDGSCKSQSGEGVPCPLFLSVEQAARHGLDFLAITDHNTTSLYNEERELQPYFDRVLLIPGRELTTYAGHANIWGTTRFVDFRAGAGNPTSRNAMLAEARALGALTSINHPIGPEAEQCIGCSWDTTDSDPATDMNLVSAVEVINGPSANPGAFFHESDIRFWEAQLARGFHLTAVGGSDTHATDLDTIGLPTTVVFAPALSVGEILNGIRAGHVFVDLTGSRTLPHDHPRVLELTASSGNEHAAMGDTLVPHPGTPLQISVHITSCLGSEIRFLVDGGPEAKLPPTRIQNTDQVVSTSWLPELAPGKPHWIRTEVRAPDGALQVLSNPVYLTPAAH